MAISKVSAPPKLVIKPINGKRDLIGKAESVRFFLFFFFSNGLCTLQSAVHINLGYTRWISCVFLFSGFLAIRLALFFIFYIPLLLIFLHLLLLFSSCSNPFCLFLPSESYRNGIDDV